MRWKASEKQKPHRASGPHVSRPVGLGRGTQARRPACRLEGLGFREPNAGRGRGEVDVGAGPGQPRDVGRAEIRLRGLACPCASNLDLWFS